LRRQKKVTKEKATRLPLESLGTSLCLALRVRCINRLSCRFVLRSSLSPRVARRAIPGPLATRCIHAAPLRLFPIKAPVLGAARDSIRAIVTNLPLVPTRCVGRN